MSIEIGNQKSQNSILLAAAMGGILSFAAACGESDKYKNATPPATDDKKEVAKELSLAEFTEICDARGGLVETHMVCGQTNTCAGISYNKYSKKTLDHTCAAKNGCGGMSCVDLAKETTEQAAKTGSEIYTASCAGCHTGEMSALAPVFKVFIKAGASDSEKAALQTLATNRTETARINLIAFGTKGLNDNGRHYSNMPAYYKRMSVNEIKKVAEFVGTMSVTVEEFPVLGQ
jgi:mono/diheme cytochrome c family protein